MAEERKWKLGEDVSISDNLLDSITFADLVLAVHCNCKEITPEAVKRELRDFINMRLSDTYALVDKNMNEIMEAAMEGRGN